jgi:hypothetical protein
MYRNHVNFPNNFGTEKNSYSFKVSRMEARENIISDCLKAQNNIGGFPANDSKFYKKFALCYFFLNFVCMLKESSSPHFKNNYT